MKTTLPQAVATALHFKGLIGAIVGLGVILPLCTWCRASWERTPASLVARSIEAKKAKAQADQMKAQAIQAAASIRRAEHLGRSATSSAIRASRALCRMIGGK